MSHHLVLTHNPSRLAGRAVWHLAIIVWWDHLHVPSLLACSHIVLNTEPSGGHKADLILSHKYVVATRSRYLWLHNEFQSSRDLLFTELNSWTLSAPHHKNRHINLFTKQPVIKYHRIVVTRKQWTWPQRSANHKHSKCNMCKSCYKHKANTWSWWYYCCFLNVNISISKKYWMTLWPWPYTNGDHNPEILNTLINHY